MRAVVPIFLVLAAAGFHTALTSSLESAEKEATLRGVGFERLTDLQKRDQEEFEAAVKKEDVESEDDLYLRLTDLQKRDQEEFEAAVKKAIEDVESEDDRYLEGEQAENIEEDSASQEEDIDKEIDENIEADQLEPESDEDAKLPSSWNLGRNLQGPDSRWWPVLFWLYWVGNLKGSCHSLLY